MPDEHRASQGSIPDHVPTHLVRDWRFLSAPGAERDPYLANSVLFDGPPIFYAPNDGIPGRIGQWIFVRADIIREASRDAESFSNRNIVGFSELVGENWSLIPVEVDRPEHAKYRGLLNPYFTPGAIAAREGQIRSTAIDLIERVRSSGRCEFERDFGRPFPVSSFLGLMGLPTARLWEFVDWEHRLVYGESLDVVSTAAHLIRDYLAGEIEQRRSAPRDDLLTALIKGRIDGRGLSHEEIMGTAYMLFFGGIDTVAAVLGFIFKYLAEHPLDQARLRDDPSLLRRAVEEFLRAFPVSGTRRIVTRDLRFHGVEFKRGDRVLLAIPAAARDPQACKDPDQIDFLREDGHSLIFGFGAHFCLGTHLARSEISIALQEWISRIPEFGLDPTDPAITHARSVWGIDRLPLIWG